jgi:membrane-associated phospholipid phosphatase
MRMNIKDFCWVAGVAAVTVLLIHYDYDIDESIRYSKDNNILVRKTSPVITEFGNTYGIGVVGVCGIAGLISGDRKLLQTSLLATQAAITSGIWVRIIKYCTSRERPSASYTADANKGHSGGYWYGPFKQYDASVTSIGRDISFFDAFPSGHTSTAFAIATVFAMQYRETKAIPVIAYSLAGLVGITRMTEHTHWASDVFVGAWAGYLCAKQVVRHHRKLFAGDILYSSQKKKNYNIFFSIADNAAGLKLKMVF